MPADGLSGSPLTRNDLPDPLDGRRIDPVRVAGLLLNPGAQRLGRHRELLQHASLALALILELRRANRALADRLLA